LKITFVRQYANDKVKAFEEILAEAGVTADDCAYIGDDLADIPLMRRVEVAIAGSRRYRRDKGSGALRDARRRRTWCGPRSLRDHTQGAGALG
jgi:3-deoxy-D-manno-octulosonate 8-phosphate phosphatase KdsC-like HAD superfamily phosphatase